MLSTESFATFCCANCDGFLWRLVAFKLNWQITCPAASRWVHFHVACSFEYRNRFGDYDEALEKRYLMHTVWEMVLWHHNQTVLNFYLEWREQLKFMVRWRCWPVWIAIFSPLIFLLSLASAWNQQIEVWHNSKMGSAVWHDRNLSKHLRHIQSHSKTCRYSRYSNHRHNDYPQFEDDDRRPPSWLWLWTTIYVAHLLPHKYWNGVGQQYMIAFREVWKCVGFRHIRLNAVTSPNIEGLRHSGEGTPGNNVSQKFSI